MLFFRTNQTTIEAIGIKNDADKPADKAWGLAWTTKDIKKTHRSYFKFRKQLLYTFLLIDIRHPLQTFDSQILDWAIHAGVPVHALLTKCDKVSKSQANNTLLSVEQEFKHLYPKEELLTSQIFSSTKKIGITELKETLDHWLTSNFTMPTQILLSLIHI